MQITAQQIYKDLEKEKWKPFYLVLGQEAFQASEIKSKFKEFFLGDQSDTEFRYDEFDGRALNIGKLISSLQTLPGLFDTEQSNRLVCCRQFEKISSSDWEKLQPYFDNPCPSTCFVMFADKADKRKAWFRGVSEKGAIVEVKEPYERDWPRWHVFFEKRLGKKIAAGAWQPLLENAQRSLSLLWADLNRMNTYTADKSEITAQDVQQFSLVQGPDNVFNFVEALVKKDKYSSVSQYFRLVRAGESEIKLLALLIRQFKMVAQYLALKESGITESRTVASRLGMAPYFVPKIAEQAQKHTKSELKRTIGQLTECDYRLKTGAGNLFEDFIVGYHSDTASH